MYFDRGGTGSRLKRSGGTCGYPESTAELEQGVRGFAFFLGLSTLIDLLVAYFFTRPAVRLLSLSNYFRGDKVLGVTAGESVAGGVA